MVQTGSSLSAIYGGLIGVLGISIFLTFTSPICTSKAVLVRYVYSTKMGGIDTVDTTRIKIQRLKFGRWWIK